jgi:hypothetical protein
MRILASFLSIALALIVLAPAAVASEHPCNVFVLGQDVRIAVPSQWKQWGAIDIDNRELAHGSAPIADLGKLPVGYFEIHPTTGAARITAAVVAPNSPVEDTPIAIDAAMSWFYPDPDQVRDACALCKLAGVKWVRDRASWPEIETARGVWAPPDTRYERTMRIEHQEGLKILQVNHISPPWASKDTRNFPQDLRDVYNFYRGLVQRWKGLADAIEPWNEPDIVMFGGQTGCQIASFQKAAYLGFKGGDPDFKVNEAVFAIDRAQTLDEFGANEVYPYFDRYDLHHYVHLDAYPRAYGRHRAVCGGRPMWTTEFNLPVWWADEKTHEPSDSELRVQGYRVGKVFSEALFQRPEKLFYFMFGDYVERHLQYGIVHADFTPRPAYSAFAAVGRFLNGAKPIGKVNLGNDKLMEYAFNTVVDGEPSETLVAWSETYPTKVGFPPGGKLYDYLGREMKPAHKVKLTPATVFIILPPGGSKSLKIEPPPAKAKWVEGKPCPVVLQLIGQGDVKQSAFQLDPSKTLKLVAYNFGDKPAHGELTLKGATMEDKAIELKPGGRQERMIQVQGPAGVTVRLDLGSTGHATAAARVLAPAPASKEPDR